MCKIRKSLLHVHLQAWILCQRGLSELRIEHEFVPLLGSNSLALRSPQSLRLPGGLRLALALRCNTNTVRLAVVHKGRAIIELAQPSGELPPAEQQHVQVTAIRACR